MSSDYVPPPDITLNVVIRDLASKDSSVQLFLKGSPGPLAGKLSLLYEDGNVLELKVKAMMQRNDAYTHLPPEEKILTILFRADDVLWIAEVEPPLAGPAEPERRIIS